MNENKTPTESVVSDSLGERSEGGNSAVSETPTEKSTPEASSTPSAGDNSELRSENSISSSGSAEERAPEDVVSQDHSSMIYSQLKTFSRKSISYFHIEND